MNFKSKKLSACVLSILSLLVLIITSCSSDDDVHGTNYSNVSTLAKRSMTESGESNGLTLEQMNHIPKEYWHCSMLEVHMEAETTNVEGDLYWFEALVAYSEQYDDKGNLYYTVEYFYVTNTNSSSDEKDFAPQYFTVGGVQLRDDLVPNCKVLLFSGSDEYNMPYHYVDQSHAF